MRLPVLAWLAAGLVLAAAAAARADDCAQPPPVCAARAAVFAIAGFDPLGSAVRIGPRRLVTARHVVADRTAAVVFLPDGTPVKAAVVPSDYPGDLLLLESDELPPGPSLSPAALGAATTLYTVAIDIGQRRIRAYDPGALRLAPPADKPLARLHHSAYSQPGNSGGALVDAAGRLVGIVASGGEGRYEAIPATAIAELEARSGPQHAAASSEIGVAVRICTTLVEDLHDNQHRLAEMQVEAVLTACRRAGNRQLLDLAGQLLGRDRRSAEAIALFEQGLAEDPNAINTRIGLVVTQHMAREFEAELPHLHWLLDNAGDDLQVLRLAIQAGAWAGDAALAERALARLKALNPQAAPAAERFLQAPPPRPAKP